MERQAEFYHQLGMMTEAGLSLVQSLESLSLSKVFRPLARQISQLMDRLEQGATFAESASSIRGWLPPFDLALLDSGERSGRLDVCFRLLSEFYRQRAQAAREVIRQLIYPALVVHVAVFSRAVVDAPQRILSAEIGAYSLGCRLGFASHLSAWLGGFLHCPRIAWFCREGVVGKDFWICAVAGRREAVSFVIPFLSGFGGVAVCRNVDGAFLDVGGRCQRFPSNSKSSPPFRICHRRRPDAGRTFEPFSWFPRYVC